MRTTRPGAEVASVADLMIGVLVILAVIWLMAALMRCIATVSP